MVSHKMGISPGARSASRDSARREANARAFSPRSVPPRRTFTARPARVRAYKKRGRRESLSGKAARAGGVHEAWFTTFALVRYHERYALPKQLGVPSLECDLLRKRRTGTARRVVPAESRVRFSLTLFQPWGLLVASQRYTPLLCATLPHGPLWRHSRPHGHTLRAFPVLASCPLRSCRCSPLSCA